MSEAAGLYRATAANRADRATRILSLNQIDDEARPLNDTSNHLTGADDMMGIPA